ncbi:MAG: hypothetical protein KJO73_07625 [Croceitalea sp.]|nr:hypothetical protein [Croceitalea sp.]
MIRKIHIIGIILLTSLALSAQEAEKDSLVHATRQPPPRTLVQRFDKSVILSQEQRAKIHHRVNTQREEILRVIDSADIAERYREKLINDLDANTYSERLKRFLLKHRKANN